MFLCILAYFSSKSCKVDPAPTYIIKDSLEVLLPSMAKIVNISLAQGIFPACWKSSMVIPLIKKPNLKRSLKNYRPVSNLTFISKVTETAAIRQYREHLTDNNQMPSRNAGYTKSHSTETILTRVHSDILCNMDKQHLMLLDLSAAFDTIDIGILNEIFQHKFKVTGSAAEWFNSYLTGRNKYITLDNIKSSEYDLKFGVPQGSCARPVIFVSYVSSL